MSRFWKNLDLKQLSIPEDIRLKKDCIAINEGVKVIDQANVFYREALPVNDSPPSIISVLLLHGQMFSSKTWLDLGTLHILPAMGYRAVAIDLPGYANSPPVKISDRASFLHSVIQSFGLQYPVIISPSMSGTFSLPYLLQNWKGIAGYVPVAPVGIEVLEELPPHKNPSVQNEVYEPLQEFLYDPVPDLSHIQTPTMVVFGERDRTRSSALLNLLPMSQCQEIPNGRHPAYLDNPNLWHQLLYNFLERLSHTYSLEN
ncbi:hypothetical protein TNCT_500781 [Trichonephila clavata]|uniref:AB hydrolase-1 domain-containing protein n=1 Tax=Trichonephila clavata TaxID=2740835 RepID=A0A8X6JD16_TRICU|nr:hypothetical protein TNCT_500781 [Trichonephila clavata]